MNVRRREFLGMVAAAGVAAATSAVAQTTRPIAGGLASLNWDGMPGSKRRRVDPIDVFFEAGPLPRLHLEMDADEMRQLDREPKTPIRGQVRESLAGEADRYYHEVGVTLKGSFGSVRPVTDKPALTLNFDKFVDAQNFHGLDKVHLNNSVQDKSYLCENLGGWVFREAGVPAPRVTGARVWLNGRDLGAYVLKEGFDRPFFKRYFKDATGDLYESNFCDVDRDMPVHLGGRKVPPVDPDDVRAVRRREQALNERRAKAWSRLRELAAACRVADPSERLKALGGVLDVERFLTFMACETMVAQWDGYGYNKNNYRVYHDVAADRLVFLPQGMDQLFQRAEHSLYGNNSLVSLAMTIENPVGRGRYLERVAEVRRGAFGTEALVGRLERIAARVRPLFEEIGAEAVAEQAARVAVLRKRIVERCAAIDRQLASPPKPLRLDEAGVAALSDWWPMVQDDGDDATTVRVEEDGRALLTVTCKAPTGGTGSWRSSQILGPGTYTFAGRVKVSGVVARRVVASSQGGMGACLRISGSRRGSARAVGDGDWQAVSHTFSVTTPVKEVTFICELSAGGGTATFDPASMTLRRRRPALDIGPGER